MKKVRALTLIFAIIMTFSAVTFSAFAQDGTGENTGSEETTTQAPADYKVSGDWQYKEIGEKAAEIVGFTGTGTECIIPAAIEGKTVVSVATGIVKNNSTLLSVVVPGTVTSLKSDSFMGCLNLKNFTVLGGALQAFDIEYCPSLEVLNLPANIKSIGKLDNCNALTSINIDAKNTTFRSVDGVVYSANLKTLVKYPAGKINSRFTIATVVTSVADYAFYQTKGNVKEIFVPVTVTAMGQNAFVESMAQILFQADKTPVGCEAAVKGMTVKHNQINIFAPVKVISNQNANTIILRWSKVAGAAGYRIWLKTAKGWSAIGTTVDTTVTYKNLKPGVRFTFAIRSLAQTPKGLVASPNFVTHETATIPFATTKIASANTDVAVKLAWLPVADADGYIVYYWTGKAWQKYKDVTTTSIFIGNLNPYTTYTFAVQTYLKTADKIIPGALRTIAVKTNLGTPTNIVRQYGDTVKFTWTPSIGASHYQVYYKINDSQWMLMNTFTKVMIPSFKTTGLKPGTKITIAVRSARVEKNRVVARSAYNPVTITLK